MKNQGRIITEEMVKSEFKEIMLCLKNERLKGFPVKGKDLASMLGKTVNYFSAVENGNEFPSMKLFLSYLLLCDFDTSPLKKLKVRAANEDGSNALTGKRVELIQKILDLDEAQVGFLLEQAKISEAFKVRKVKER